MSSIEIRGMWNIIRGIIRQRWSWLTADDSGYAEGRFEEIAGRVQMLTGQTYRRLKMAPWK